MELIGAGVAQVHLVRAAGVIARVVQRAHQRGQALVDDGLRNALIAAAPDNDGRMMTEVQNAVARILQKQRRILRFKVIALRGFPEIVPHHEAIFIGQGVEILLRILAHPVADDVDVRIAMQAKIGLETRNADALAAVVHAPVAAARGDAHAVDLDHQIGTWPSALYGPNGRRALSARLQRMHPCVPEILRQRLPGRHLIRSLVVDLPNALMRLLDQRQFRIVRAAGQHFDATQVASRVEERSLITHLTHAEIDLLRAQGSSGPEAHLERVQSGLSVAVGPPEPRMVYLELRKLFRLELHNGFAWFKLYVLRDLHVVEAGCQVAFDRSAGRVGQRRLNLNVRLAAIGFGQRSNHVQVAHLHDPSRRQRHVLPDAGVAVANTGNPVPPFSGGKRGPVEHFHSAVLAWASLD